MRGLLILGGLVIACHGAESADGDWPCGESCGSPMRLIPGGSFEMGAIGDAGDERERPSHQTRVPSFWIDERETTAAEYAGFLRSLISRGTPNRCSYLEGEMDCVRCAVVDRTLDCDDLAPRVACQSGASGEPAEAEWEWAARRPEQPDGEPVFPWGQACPQEFRDERYAPSCSGPAWTSATARANCAETNCGDGYARTSPVGSFPSGATADGLLDMGGNVWEWVEDCWHAGYDDAPEDGTAWTSNCHPYGRVERGGSWHDVGFSLRTTHRAPIVPAEGHAALGCRCARSDGS